MYGRSGAVLADIVKIVDGSATCGAQVTAGNIPASGSFVNVAGYERVHILCKLGAIAGSDTPTLEPKCSDAADGTVDQIDASLAHTAADNDDEEWVAWTIEVDKLPTDHHFLTVVASGTLVGTYAEIFFLLEERDIPVGAYTALPAASRYVWAG